MPSPKKLPAYHLYDSDWESFEEIREAFEWEIPQSFNIATYISERWADAADLALIYEDEDGFDDTLSFARVDARASRLASSLADLGIGPGDRVGINLPQRPETLLAHVAVWKLGGTTLPLSTLFGTDALSYRLNDAAAGACIVDQSNVETFRSAQPTLETVDEVVTVGVEHRQGGEHAYESLVGSGRSDVKAVDTDPDESALITYTSGTTGDPKGVVHGHRVLLGHLPAFNCHHCNLEQRANDLVWNPSEWAWLGSFVNSVLPALFFGLPVMVYNGEFDARTATRIIDEHDVTIWSMAPTGLRMVRDLSADERQDMTSLRSIVTGGEAVEPELIEWTETSTGATVHQGYGQTEANGIVGNCSALTEPRYMGHPLPGHEVTLLDPKTLDPVPPGEVGEIAVRYEDNPTCFKEYLNEPEKTTSKVKEGWLLSEDLATRDDDGFYEFVSRKDDVIISSGRRIGPEEIEGSLSTHPAVSGAGVIGVPDDRRGDVPKAFVHVHDDVEPTEDLVDELEAHVKRNLAEYEYPRYIEFVDSLPRTVTDKTDRAELRAREGIVE